MKSFFDKHNQQELLQRLDKLSPDARPLWGQMTPAQMLAHCAAAFKTPTGELQLKPYPWPMKLLGRMLKKSILSDKPYRKNSPTAAEFLVRDSRDFAKEKQLFLESFLKLAAGPQAVAITNHPFFGKMTAAEWGRHMYKHTDHHFTQFGI